MLLLLLFLNVACTACKNKQECVLYTDVEKHKRIMLAENEPFAELYTDFSHKSIMNWKVFGFYIEYLTFIISSRVKRWLTFLSKQYVHVVYMVKYYGYFRVMLY